MAAYAALVSLMCNIEQMMSHPRLSTCFDNNQIQPLHEKAAFLLDFIESHHIYCGGDASKEAQDLERRMASAAHAAEDVIESHIADQILAEQEQKRKANEQKKMIQIENWKRRTTGSAEDVDPIHFDAGSNQASLGCSLDLQQIIQEMNGIMEKANELKEKEALSLSKEQQPTHTHPTPALTETGEVTTAAMVGFEDELIQLLDELTNQQSSRRIISIMGMGGSGKTTLAQKVYANPLIIEHFDIRAWATVSQRYSCFDKKVIKLGERLHKTLTGRRYLIILDDIWSVKAWDQVRPFFPDDGNGSRIVLTTRLSNVANDCGSSCLSKHLLDENESWELFCKKAFPHEDCPPQLEEVGKEIVRLCKGLPLSIVVIGGRLLKSPRDLGYWKNVATNIKSNPNSTEKQESVDVLLSKALFSSYWSIQKLFFYDPCPGYNQTLGCRGIYKTKWWPSYGRDCRGLLKGSCR